MKVLVAGVGYTVLRDLSFGPEMVRRFQLLKWPQNVEVEDLSYGPVTVIQKLTEKKYGKIILIGAVKRNRAAGTLHKYRPHGSLPDEEEIQGRMGEGVAGVISLDSLVILGRFYQAFPENVVVIEVEPEDDSWGEGFTPGVEEAVEKVTQMVREEVGIV